MTGTTFEHTVLHASPMTGSWNQFKDDVSEGVTSPTISDRSSDSQLQRNRRRACIACLRCRSLKVKCDGAAPSCTRCSKKKACCQYERISSQESALISRKRKAAKQLDAVKDAVALTAAKKPIRKHTSQTWSDDAAGGSYFDGAPQQHPQHQHQHQHQHQEQHQHQQQEFVTTAWASGSTLTSPTKSFPRNPYTRARPSSIEASAHRYSEAPRSLIQEETTALPIITAMCDDSLRCLRVSHECEALRGYHEDNSSRSSAPMYSLLDIIHPDDLSALRSDVRRRLVAAAACPGQCCSPSLARQRMQQHSSRSWDFHRS